MVCVWVVCERCCGVVQGEGGVDEGRRLSWGGGEAAVAMVTFRLALASSSCHSVCWNCGKGHERRGRVCPETAKTAFKRTATI